MFRKLGFPLLVTIVTTIAINFIPIVLGRGMTMYGCFAIYLGFLMVLAQMDRRVLGYAMALSVCSTAGGLAPLSYSLILGLVILLRYSSEVQHGISQFASQRWGLLLMLAAGTALLSLPMWSHDPRGFLTDMKHYLSRLGFVVIAGPALLLTIRDAQDSLRLTRLVCALTAAAVACFYFLGQKGVPAEYVWNVGIYTYEAYMQIGNAYLLFTRTQMCILMAVVAAVSMALTVATFPRPSAILSLVTGGFCVYMIMELGSTGSAFAMTMGMGIAALGYVVSRPSALRIAMAIIVVTALGFSLVYAVFQTDNFLAKRIDLKQRAGQIDRMELWIGAVEKAAATPIGSGWTTEISPKLHTHNDFLNYFLSFGWLGGAFYFAGCFLVGLWLLRELLRVERDDTNIRAVVLAGLAGITVYGANSMLDMLSAGIGNYQTVWMLILVPASICTLRRSGASESMVQIPPEYQRFNEAAAYGGAGV